MIKKLSILAFLIFINHFLCFSQSDVSETNETINNENLIDSLKSLLNSQDYYKIEISFSGYESGSEETWYYDSLGVICAYHLNWDMEGQSGENYHWFENGKMSVLYEETTGGNDETEIKFLKKPADSDKLKNYDSDSKNQEQKTFNLINENSDKKVEDENTVSITIEETVNYGGDFTQTTNIYIDKALYEILFDGK